MIRRLALLAALLPLSGFAQLALYSWDGTTETPVTGAFYNVGSAAPGDTLEARFHVRNTGAAAATLDNLSVAGAGFSLDSVPSLPYTIPPGGFASFRVAFQPDIAAGYSAVLQVETITVTLIATSTPALNVLWNHATLNAGGTIDFCRIQYGKQSTQTITLSNPTASTLTVSSVAVGGAGFSLSPGLTTPVTLTPGQSISFTIVFNPSNAQTASGSLTIGDRSFVLTGVGVQPAFPAATIAFDQQNPTSSTQVNLSITLASAAPLAASGNLTMQFQPSVTGISDDPAIQFLTNSSRTVSWKFNQGDTTAQFNTTPASSSVAFQTGTTAGTITFTMDLPDGTQQTSTLTIAPAPVTLDLQSSILRTSDIDVSLTGWDNTHSTSKLTFTFYDSQGKTVAPGAIPVDVTQTFQTYFSTTKAGGAFALLATFPVTGTATLVSAVDVTITNSAGTTGTQHITIQP